MRIRAAREIGIILGIAVLLFSLVFVNAEIGRTSLKDRMVKWRKQIEQQRGSSGLDLLKWPLLQETTGGVRSGPTFDSRLLKYQGQKIDIIGFMVGLNRFRNMREFLLLPMPIECYFCQQPPIHDVVLIEMADGHPVKSLYKEPVLINGTLTLNQGPNTKFFYVVNNANLGPGQKGGVLTRKIIKFQHTLPHHTVEGDTMIPGQAPPKPTQLNTKEMLDKTGSSQTPQSSSQAPPSSQ